MKSPFKFLDSYTKDDREIFFGRDREIEELYHRVFESKIMLVYGVSGTGKSSLIHCGLANKFQDTDWLPIVIRRGGNIIESMAAGIRSASLTEQQNKFSNSSDFKKGVRSLYLDHYKPVFFIFDQFEELFIFGNKEERKSFIHIVKLLTDSELQCRMIFVMREEYMAGVTEFEKYIPTFFSNRVRIEKMSHLNALEAIKQPCKVFNINLEEGFAESLLEKLSPGETDVELTYLQVFLDKIFRLAVQDKPLLGGVGGSAYSGAGVASFTLDLLSRTGNVSDLLGSFLEEQLKALDEPDTGLSILKSFVSLKGTKKQLSAQEIIDSSRAFGKDIPADKVADLVLKFVNLRILRDKDGNGKYELRHDSLAAKIYEKITLVEKELMEINQFLENALLLWQKRKLLLNVNDLKYLAPYEDSLFVNRDIKNLIDQSKKEQDNIKRRIKRVAIAGFISLIVFAIGAIMMAYQIRFAGKIRLLGLLVYSFWFLPIFSYYIIKSRENRAINLLFLFFTILFVSNVLLYNTSIRKVLFQPIYFTEQKYQSALELVKKDNDSLYFLIDKAITKNDYSTSPAESTEYGQYRSFTMNFKERSDEIYIFLQGIKIELIRIVEGEKTKAVQDNIIDFSIIKKIDEKNLTSEILIGTNDNGKAYLIKMLLEDYKEYLLSSTGNDQMIKFTINGTLNTEDLLGSDKNTTWEYYNFQGQSLGFAIINLTKIQLDIKNAESRVLTYIVERINNLN